MQHPLLKDERRTIEVTTAGRLRVGIGYPNTYAVGMSSLAYQWAVELAAPEEEPPGAQSGSCGFGGVAVFGFTPRPEKASSV